MAPTIFEEKLRHEWTASVLVLRPDRRILLLFHEKLRVWLGPGGHIEPGETPDEAAVREVEEETELQVVLLGQRDHRLDDPQHGVTCLHAPYVVLKERIHDARDPHVHLDMIYCARLTDEAVEPARSGAGRLGAGYFAEAELDDLPMFRNFRALLKRVFRDPSLWDSLGAPHGPVGQEVMDVGANHGS
jgi:8-oxo-dGTP pyrophosphatase MutT (NUDIX family)